LPSTSGWHSIWGKRPTDSRARQGKQFSSNAKSALTIRLAPSSVEGRIGKTVAGDTTQYVLDLASTLPVVISDTEAVYLYGLDIIAQQHLGRDSTPRMSSEGDAVAPRCVLAHRGQEAVSSS